MSKMTQQRHRRVAGVTSHPPSGMLVLDWRDPAPGEAMRRREFITLLGGAVAGWPRSTRAQQSAKPPIIGYLGPTSTSTEGQWTPAFVRRLHQLGWIEGSTVDIEYRWAEGHVERLSALADTLVQLKVSVIVTNATPPTIAAKRATSVIPIVFAVSGDPVGAGLVASLARPGGNVTGLSLQSVEAVSKRVELLRDVVPNLRRLAVLTNGSNPVVRREVEEVQVAAHALGVEIIPLDVRRADDIAPAFATLDGRADALYVTGDPLFGSNSLPISALALKARLPDMHILREEVVAGGLLSYGAHFPDLYRRAADLVNKILRGTKPADIPVEQPTKFDLVINLKTAKALGLTISDKMLALADELIE
jgi:putative tryptophan/tyrosine transport system substrate-binding protein